MRRPSVVACSPSLHSWREARDPLLRVEHALKSYGLLAEAGGNRVAVASPSCPWPPHTSAHSGGKRRSPLVTCLRSRLSRALGLAGRGDCAHFMIRFTKFNANQELLVASLAAGPPRDVYKMRESRCSLVDRALLSYCVSARIVSAPDAPLPVPAPLARLETIEMNVQIGGKSRPTCNFAISREHTPWTQSLLTVRGPLQQDVAVLEAPMPI
jgi:hypothetical protein